MLLFPGPFVQLSIIVPTTRSKVKEEERKQVVATGKREITKACPCFLSACQKGGKGLSTFSNSESITTANYMHTAICNNNKQEISCTDIDRHSNHGIQHTLTYTNTSRRSREIYNKTKAVEILLIKCTVRHPMLCALHSSNAFD